MFKKLLIASVILATSTSMALAQRSYDYKGERVVAPPCPTYSFAAAPYLGLSIGPRTNFLGTPAVQQGLTGTVSAGYAGMVNPADYLAGELFVNGNLNLKDYRNTLNAGTPFANTVSAKSN